MFQPLQPALLVLGLLPQVPQGAGLMLPSSDGQGEAMAQPVVPVR